MDAALGKYSGKVGAIIQFSIEGSLDISIPKA